MNEIIESLLSRRSVRVFEERAVPAAEKEAILLAAVNAPTAGCQQLYTILDVTDPELKARLAESCDHQPFIAKAPLVLVFCADCQKWYDAYAEAGCAPRAPGPGDLLLAVADACIAAQNAVTAAESLGLGSCYIGDILERCGEHRALLDLPEWVVPAAMLVMGWPTGQQRQRPKPERFPLEHIVCENRYRRRDGAQLREMFAGQTGAKSFEDWLGAFCQRKYESGFSREMNRSAAEYLKAFPWKEEAR